MSNDSIEDRDDHQYMHTYVSSSLTTSDINDIAFPQDSSLYQRNQPQQFLNDFNDTGINLRDITPTEYDYRYRYLPSVDSAFTHVLYPISPLGYQGPGDEHMV